MEIDFFLEKSVDENAGRYFDTAKKNKKKLEGAHKALAISKEKLEKLLKDEAKYLEREEIIKEKKNRKREWYEKFHWFMTSQGFLCIGGKDATSNEIVVKKHMEKEDLVFHTDMAGSPFFVIKGGEKATDISIAEAAQATAVYSKAWKLGHGTADVFYVKPDQVSKEAQAGENLPKGAFMVRGKTLYQYPQLEYAIGLVGREVIGGPETAISKQTDKFVILIPGREKKSVTAKKIRKELDGGDLDDLIKFIPAGGAELKKIRRKKKT